jgi:hypothetical protein
MQASAAALLACLHRASAAWRLASVTLSWPLAEQNCVVKSS